MRGMRKYPVDSLVLVLQDDGSLRQATVVRHGRDMGGVYTEVRYADGSTEKMHRSAIYPLKSDGVSST